MIRKTHPDQQGQEKTITLPISTVQRNKKRKVGKVEVNRPSIPSQLNLTNKLIQNHLDISDTGLTLVCITAYQPEYKSLLHGLS